MANRALLKYCTFRLGGTHFFAPLYCINDPGAPWGHPPPGMATNKYIINSPLKQTLTSDQKLQKAFFGNWRKESLTKKKKKGGLAVIRALTSALLVQGSNDAIKLGSHLRAVHYIGS